MSSTHHTFTRDAYSPRANDYLTSAVHANGEDLDQLESAVRGHPNARVLDIGCGGGHVSYRVAPHVAQVTAVDLSTQMLETVARTAAERGLHNITTQCSAAEELPFADGQFDFVLTRFSAHHWRDFESGLRQARRVSAPASHAMFVDVIAPTSALLDTHLQTLELLRDPSHVRNYTLAEWTSALARSGFEVRSVHRRHLRIDFASWIARTRTPEPLVAAIRLLQQNAPAEVAAHFALEPDGSFLLEAATIEATPA
jgi:ubiquinone/menaquinone biosynthesis C-methylase UbiE